MQIIISLRKGLFINIDSRPLPQPLENIIDLAKFSNFTNTETSASAPSWHLEQAHDSEKHQNKNVFKKISPVNLNQLLSVCREHNVTFTHALTAAFALSLFEMRRKKDTLFDFYIAVDFRPYTNPVMTNHTLAFYAQPAVIKLALKDNLDLFEIAKDVQTQLLRAISAHKIESVDNTENIITFWKTCIANQQPFISNCISNVGKIDDAFHDIAPYYTLEEYFFTVSQQNTPQGLAIFCSTLNDTCYFNFNFSFPAMSVNWVEQLVKKIFDSLSRATSIMLVEL
ncbi:MAG: hypothetical protein NTV32_10485 [Gammaproteobacteria bacterium]|nr:hypothetical protein [Gammaproteobacteria bacterium]